MTKQILLAGETFVVTQSVAIGYENITSSFRANGAIHLLDALHDTAYQITQIASEQCETEFPRDAKHLEQFSAVVLSDIGALSMLFTPESRAGKVSVNRLAMLHDWVKDGGSLMMAGGYNSFQGMSATARYHQTPIEDCLPVTCLASSDGLEAPEGLIPQQKKQHPILKGLRPNLPPVLGMNRVLAKPDPDCEVILDVPYRGTLNPLLVVRDFGKGRTLAWMTDIGPHWMSQDFIQSSDYKVLMRNMMAWLCRDI